MPETPHLARVRRAFSAQAPRFDAYAPKADPETAERFARALGVCATGRILDMACGTGAVTAALAPAASEIIGIDATEAMLDRARARMGTLPNVGFRTGDAEALPFADAAFDAVVTRLSLHHLARPERALAEMARVLRPGGRAVVVDIVGPDDPDAAALQDAIETLRDPSQTRLLAAAELDRLVTSAGLAIARRESWERTRDLDEWLGITAELAAPAPLATLLKALAAAAVDTGMNLALRDGRVTFVHRWRLVGAEKQAQANG